MSKAEAVLFHDQLIALARSLGYTVRIGPPDPGHPDNAIGATDGQERRIWVSSETGPAVRLLTLLHELGHALAARRMGHDPEESETGERRAYLYGWAVLRHVGIPGGPQQRKMWREFHALDPRWPHTHEVKP